jgi:hypothetical protein
MLPWERITGQDKDLVNFISTLTHFRRTSKALQNGRFIEMYKDYGIYAFVKWVPGQAVLVVLNSSAFSEGRDIPMRGQLLPEHGVFKDIFTDSLFSYSTHTFRVHLKPRGARLLLYQGEPLNEVFQLPWQCDFTPALTKDLRMVTFAYKAAAQVQQVAVAGDFNGWSATENEMCFSQDAGKWSASLPLKNGRYRYKFVLNGSEWIADPGAKEYELDPYGGKNSVIIVR